MRRKVGRRRRQAYVASDASASSIARWGTWSTITIFSGGWCSDISPTRTVGEVGDGDHLLAAEGRARRRTEVVPAGLRTAGARPGGRGGSIGSAGSSRWTGCADLALDLGPQLLDAHSSTRNLSALAASVGASRPRRGRLAMAAHTSAGVGQDEASDAGHTGGRAQAAADPHVVPEAALTLDRDRWADVLISRWRSGAASPTPTP